MKKDWNFSHSWAVIVAEAAWSMKKDWNFSDRWAVIVAGSAWNPPVCCTLERGGFLFMSKDVEWKLRQERGVVGV